MDYNKSIAYAIEILKINPKDIWRIKNINIQIKPLDKIPTNIQDKIKNLITKYKYFYDLYSNQFPDTIDALLMIYDHMGALDNVALSITPDKKKLWREKYNATHELFGAFFNTDPQNTYCSRFAELEKPRATCNALTFIPEIRKTYIVNPPYDEFFINWTLYNIIYNWTESSFIIVIPDWRLKIRKKYGLKSDFKDMNSINEIIEYCDKKKYKYIEYAPKKYKFYNGMTLNIYSLNTAILEIYILR